MSLGMKLAIKTGAMIALTTLIAGVSIFGLLGLRGSFHVAEHEYEQLRTIYEIGHHLASARLLLRSETPDALRIDRELQAARRGAESLSELFDLDPVAARNGREPLAALRGSIRQPDAGKTGAAPSRELDVRLTAGIGQVSTMIESVRSRLAGNRRAARGRFRTTVGVMFTIGAITLVVALFVGVSQYRNVMSPLRNLQRGVAQIARGRFDVKLERTGDREFQELSARFNDMASELQSLYGALEQQVEIKSRQLVRSERLAGTGRLAAGFAHEINNPLCIMSGHAQAALRRIERQPPEDLDEKVVEQTRESLRIIHDEAFRCKDITDKLLTLASPGSGCERRPVRLGDLARRVVKLLGNLPQFDARRVEIEVDDESRCVALGDEAELTQAVVNLVLNALEATAPEEGVVRVSVRRRLSMVRLSVRDNGRGMDEATQRSVFDPFYSGKWRQDKAGCGLGLPVSQAIVEQHGGRLFATSDGPGAGSVFTIELPVVDALQEIAL